MDDTDDGRYRSRVFAERIDSGESRTFVGRSAPTDDVKGTLHMTASAPPPVPRLVRALMDVREILERARRTGAPREIEAAIERINAALDGQG